MHVLNVRPHLDPAASFPSHSFGFDFWFEWQRLRLACGLASSHYCTIVIFEFLCSSPWFNLTIRWPNRKKELELRVRWSNDARRLGGAFPAGQKRSTSSRRARAALNLLAKWKKMCFFFVKINHFFSLPGLTVYHNCMRRCLTHVRISFLLQDFFSFSHYSFRWADLEQPPRIASLISFFFSIYAWRTPFVYIVCIALLCVYPVAFDVEWYSFSRFIHLFNL